jgi:hypothetical protein
MSPSMPELFQPHGTHPGAGTVGLSSESTAGLWLEQTQWQTVAAPMSVLRSPRPRYPRRQQDRITRPPLSRHIYYTQHCQRLDMKTAPGSSWSIVPGGKPGRDHQALRLISAVTACHQNPAERAQICQWYGDDNAGLIRPTADGLNANSRHQTFRFSATCPRMPCCQLRVIEVQSKRPLRKRTLLLAIYQTLC